MLVCDQYDDCNVSGGTLERPGLKWLTADIENGLVDVVVVYKIDRLSRSLTDFTKLVEVFDRNGATFVSVSQSFNTTTSMGRLTLNILLSFAQLHVRSRPKRIRDEVAASRRKGMRMGELPPYGYRVENRKLLADEDAAAQVRWIFARFLEIGSCTMLAQEVEAKGTRTSRGNRIDKKCLYRVLSNGAYVGEAVHKGDSQPEEHDAIIDRTLWDKVHLILKESPRVRGTRTRARTPALLKGLIFGPDGAAFSPTHTRKVGKLYRYYFSQSVLKFGKGAFPIGHCLRVIWKLRWATSFRLFSDSQKLSRGHGKKRGRTNQNLRSRCGPCASAAWSSVRRTVPGRAGADRRAHLDRDQIRNDRLNVRLRLDGLMGLDRELTAKVGGAS